jgi:lysozyme
MAARPEKAHSRRKVLLGLGGLVGVAGLGALAYPHVYPHLYPYLEPGRLWYNVIGVDVSHHQGEIDWPELAGTGIAFAYMKASEGGDFRDRRFAANWEEARKAGVARGAYHYFTQCRTGAEQARNFIDAVPREAGTLPPAADLEHFGPCRSGAQVANLVGEITTFIDMLAEHYGRRPIIYTYADFDAAYLQGHFTRENFWARSLTWLPPSFRTDQWLIWQYHDSGRRAGINGPVDLNAFRGSRRDFNAFVTGGGAI